MTTDTIATVARGTATKVGSREEFDAIVATWGSTHVEQQVALAQMIAFAYSAFHKSSDRSPMDAIRTQVRVSKTAARKLENTLARIPRTDVPEGQSVAQAALKYGNEFAAVFYGEETKARAQAREKARAKREEAAKEAKRKAEEELKAAKAEAKAEAREELERELDLPEFALLGEEGVVTPLTPDEYTALALTLQQMRDDREAGKAASRKATRQHAKEQREGALTAVV